MAYFDEEYLQRKNLERPSAIQSSGPDYAAFEMSQPQQVQSKVEAPQSQGMNAGKVVEDTATGAAVGGPVGAGIAAGGSLLTQYLAERAAEERQKRAQAVQIAQQLSQDESRGYETLSRMLTGALR